MGLSKKAEREQVRERLLRSGSSYAEVVDEMCRQFRVRPRTGWRYALGWEMWKVAQELVAANPKARVDVPRISRWESWPIGKGSSQPSLHDLAGLAMAFGHGCTVADLVDQADLAEFSPAERRLVAAIVSGETARGASRPAVRVGNGAGEALASLPLGALTPAAERSSVSSPRQAGVADVAAMNVMAEAFAQTDHRLGGGHASATVGHYLQHAVYPALAARRDDAVGQSLLVAAGRLHNLAGFMSFDAEQHVVGQRHFADALGLARAAGDDALTAHILGDMTMQAIHTGAVGQAVVLSDGAVSHAERTSSPRILARAHALAARARASIGDVAGADAMMTRAERVMDRPEPEDDPTWIRFFSTVQLQTEFLYAACALGRLSEVDRLAPAVLITDAAMRRRHVLAGAAIASALTSTSGWGPRTEPERAVHVLTQILPTVRRLSSPRSLASVVAVRSQLSRFGALPGLDALDHALAQETIADP